MHTGVIGEVVGVPDPGEDVEIVLVEMNDFLDGRGALVTLGVSGDGSYSSADLTAGRAREVASLLGRAADLLDGGAR